MIDAHTHLENGELSKEYVYAFIEAAQARGIKHLYILDHTHRFFEFRKIYQGVCTVSERQRAWFEKKQKNSIREYWQLIETMKQEVLPIKVSFGLEVCYTPQSEALLRPLLAQYPYDFLVGSVHSVFDYLYDMDAFSKELLWNRFPAETIYRQYYRVLEQLMDSRLFTQVGHPDTIKMYQIDPGYELHDTYVQMAKAALRNHVLMEDNTGAHYRYHHPEVGLHPHFRKVLRAYGVNIITASDAHVPAHVGKCFDKLEVYGG